MGHLEVAEQFITHGQKHGQNWEIRSLYQETALHIASRHGRVEAVDWLLKAGLDVNYRFPGKSTALMLASEKGHLKVVERLLDGGADVKLKVGFDEEAETALDIARRMKYQEIVDLLEPLQ